LAISHLLLIKPSSESYRPYAPWDRLGMRFDDAKLQSRFSFLEEFMRRFTGIGSRFFLVLFGVDDFCDGPIMINVFILTSENTHHGEHVKKWGATAGEAKNDDNFMTKQYISSLLIPVEMDNIKHETRHLSSRFCH
jgi:hypothetical protein